jgi:hypothetical protein
VAFQLIHQKLDLNQTERLFGCERAQLPGQPVELLIPEKFREKHPSHRGGFFANPRPRAMGAGMELNARRLPLMSRVDLKVRARAGGSYRAKQRKSKKRLSSSVRHTPAVAVLKQFTLFECGGRAIFFSVPIRGKRCDV